LSITGMISTAEKSSLLSPKKPENNIQEQCDYNTDDDTRRQRKMERKPRPIDSYVSRKAPERKPQFTSEPNYDSHGRKTEA
jgi:hypothetical protein